MSFDSMKQMQAMTKKPDGRLNITSMMDMFTIILVFLLWNFSIEDANLQIEKGLQLPGSISEKNYRQSKVILTMTADVIKMNNIEVVQLKNGDPAAKDIDGEQIIPLYEALVKIREEIPELQEEGSIESQLVLFQADKTIPFKQLKPVMKTAGMAGYPNFWFAVMKEE